MSRNFSEAFLDETLELVRALNTDDIEAVAGGLKSVRQAGGRLFILGVGGSAGQIGNIVNIRVYIASADRFACDP